MKLRLGWSVLVFSLLAMHQAQTPAYEALLQRPSRLKSLSGTLTVKGQEGNDQWEMVYRVEFQHPNKFRIQTLAIQSPKPRQPFLLISDGSAVQKIEVVTKKQQLVQWSEFKPESLGEETTSLLLQWLLAPDRLKNTLETKMQADPNLTLEKVKGEDCQVVRWRSKPGEAELEFAFWVALDGVPRQAVTTRKGEASFTIREQWNPLSIDPPIEASRFALQPSESKPAKVASKSSETAPAKPKKRNYRRIAKAPDFTLRALTGQTVRLSNLRGKPVFLDFWATWCGPCRMTLPHTQTIYKHLGDKVHVLAVNLQEDPETIREFLRENRYTFPVLLDTQGTAARAYGVEGIPTFVLIDEEGYICWVKVGASQEMERELYRMLKEIGVPL